MSCFLSLFSLSQVSPSLSAVWENLPYLNYCPDGVKCMVAWWNASSLPLSPQPRLPQHILSPQELKYSFPEV